MYSNTDKYYTPKELAEILGIESVTLRKYSIALEKVGYIFLRNDSDRRLYSERDVIALQQLKALRYRNALNVENAARVVATKQRQVNDTSEIVTQNDSLPAISDLKRYDERYSSIEAKIDAQAEKIALMSTEIEELVAINQELFTALDELTANNRHLQEIIIAQKAISAAEDDNQEQREKERDEKLMQVLREIREVKQQSGKSIFKRIFGR